MEHRELTDSEFNALRELADAEQRGVKHETKSPELETLCDIGYVDPVMGGGFYLTDRGRETARGKGWLS